MPLLFLGVGVKKATRQYLKVPLKFRAHWLTVRSLDKDRRGASTCILLASSVSTSPHQRCMAHQAPQHWRACYAGSYVHMFIWTHGHLSSQQLNHIYHLVHNFPSRPFGVWMTHRHACVIETLLGSNFPAEPWLEIVLGCICVFCLAHACDLYIILMWLEWVSTPSRSKASLPCVILGLQFYLLCYNCSCLSYTFGPFVQVSHLPFDSCKFRFCTILNLCGLWSLLHQHSQRGSCSAVISVGVYADVSSPIVRVCVIVCVHICKFR